MEAAPDCSRPAGVLRRAVAFHAVGDEVRAALEDDYHHFRVAIRHRDGVVVAVESETPRVPWTACAFAGEDWSGFIGLPLEPRSSAIAARAEMRLYCTHMYELAGAAMAAAARGVSARRYDAAVPYGARKAEAATVLRDGQRVLSWRLDGDVIQDAGPYHGVSVRKGFAGWVDSHLDVDEAEAALILRRALIISGGRVINLDAARSSNANDACYTTNPSRAPTALRVVGSTQDFEQRPEALLEADLDWLAFGAAEARAALTLEARAS
jgi:hypothetical protein